jgi:hypothetical protein
MVLSASLLVKMSRSGRVAKRRIRSSKGQEPAGDAAGVFRGGGAAVEIRGQPGGRQFLLRGYGWQTMQVTRVSSSPDESPA